MNALQLEHVSKSYTGFQLQDVSLTLPCGSIMGFVGENGAGKSTTIKLILDLISRDSGNIQVLGKDNQLQLNDVKEQIGVVMDECNFSEVLNLKQINTILKHIYTTWDSDRFYAKAKQFSLPETKKIKEYSKGMKMKLSIAVALSHGAKLLILDEATSGLDPIVRDELLDEFLEFIQDASHAVFISSHITSDLEKICDYITFIHQGKIILSEERELLEERLAILNCTHETLEQLPPDCIIGARKNQFGAEALVRRQRCPDGLELRNASLEEIMLYHIKEGIR